MPRFYGTFWKTDRSFDDGGRAREIVQAVVGRSLILLRALYACMRVWGLGGCNLRECGRVITSLGRGIPMKVVRLEGHGDDHGGWTNYRPTKDSDLSIHSLDSRRVHQSTELDGPSPLPASLPILLLSLQPSPRFQWRKENKSLDVDEYC